MVAPPFAACNRWTGNVAKSQMNADERGLNEVTEKIIGCAYRVANVLGAGFLEKVYENALRIELEEEGFDVQQQHWVRVIFGKPKIEIRRIVSKL